MNRMKFLTPDRRKVVLITFSQFPYDDPRRGCRLPRRDVIASMSRQGYVRCGKRKKWSKA